MDSSQNEPISQEWELPLSFAQERMWFFEQFQAGTATYNMPGAVRMTGLLDVQALKQSLQTIWNRHEALRMKFAVIDGEVIGTLNQADEFRWIVRDLHELPIEEREKAAQRLAQEEAQTPFDLTKDALLRTTLVQLGAEENVLLVTMHHIISDGWSIAIFMRELATLYRAFVEGKGAQAEELLPVLDIQYADFAHWQRDWLTGDVLQTQLAYWKEQLRGELPVLQLPTDRPRPAMQTFNGGTVPVQVSAQLTGLLKQWSQREGVTLYMTLLAAFQTLLYRYAGQEDLLVGSPIAGRNNIETEQLIGFFVNTLVLRTDLSGDPSFREFVLRVRDVAVAAYAHQEVPFEKLVEELQPTRSMTYSPLFQVMFALQQAQVSAFELPGLKLNVQNTSTGTAKFDLTLELTDRGDELSGTFEYNSDLFDRATIERMVGHFHVLLEAVMAQSELPISRVPLLTDVEREQLLVQWNQTDVAYPHDVCLQDLFEAQAMRTPDGIAVVDENQSITYAELNRRANQLAHRLQRQGVGRDVLVGICMERSVELVVGVMGILKAGGAYVPLDATYPSERLAFLLADSQTPVVLTQERVRHKLPAQVEGGRQAEVICLEAGLHVLDGEPETASPCRSTPDDLAYVIYTSGTTGQPKGALLAHCGVVNLLSDLNERKSIAAGEGCAVWSNFGFDLSVMELFSGLLFGGRLHLLPDEMRADSAGYFRWLATNDIRHAYLPPFLLKDLVQQLRSGASLPLQRILVGVESIHEPLLAEIKELLPEVTIINAYGPTEATVCATFYTFDPANVQDRNTPIGVPVQNTHVYVLDEHLQPVPIGVPGELHTGGLHVARGYLHRQELTAEKFIPSPFVAGERLYKTGDLVRVLPDGNIEYIARRDNQVKLRGFRIELGEIETVLIQHPAVRETVVLVQEIGHAKTLVAYVVTDTAQTPFASDMRQFLKGKLPDYMVPTAFVWLDALPLTPNGKVDRRALPAPDPSDLQRNEYVAPRTQAEELLVTVFAEVLGVAQVGVQDNFFELGGHSLLATQVVSRVRSLFHVELPLRALFETATVAELAVVIGATEGMPAEADAEAVEVSLAVGAQHAFADAMKDAPPLVVLPREEHRIQRIRDAVSASMVQEAYAFPLSFAQQRLWFLEQFMPGNTSYNIPVAVRLQGELHVVALEEALAETVKRHEALRTTFAMVDGEPMQIIEPFSENTPHSLPVIDLCEFPLEEREGLSLQLAIEEAKLPFDLTQGPLVRTTLLRLGEQEHVLLLTMHHIVSDGWSMGVFIQEIAALYETRISGTPASLSSLPVQYADFADWQQKWLAGGVLETQLGYWKQKLAGRLAVLQLPTDRSRPAVQSFVGATLPIAFGDELTQRLKSLAKQEGVTLYMTLLAAFKTLLYRYTGQEDILVGSPIAGRVREEIEGLIGFFVNTLVLRTDLSGEITFRDLLSRVREVSLEAYAHQDVPFEKLVEELQPERDLSHTPLFQVMFILQNAPMGALELPGLSLQPLATDNGTSKFDLTLSLTETDGRLTGSLEYSTDLFDETTIQRLSAHLQNLLEGIVADPQQALLHIPLLTEAERQQVLVDWNDTKVAYPTDVCAHHLFEAQVERTPEAIALQFGEDYLTYRELNQLSNQVAHHLQDLGVRPDVCVGLCMDRSLEMVIALLAIHKAGGAYVALDPTYPQDRLAFMVEESQLTVLLTQSHLTNVLPVQGGSDVQVRVVALDTAWDVISELSGDNLVSGVTQDHLGYVLYTSGSTGRPKGVAMSHGPITNLIQWQLTDSDAGVGTKTLQFTSLNFDVSFQEIMSTFASGGTLVMVKEALRKDPVQLYQFLVDQRIERLFLPFVALQQLAEAADGAASTTPCSLREIMTAGEQLQITRQLANWMRSMPECTLSNHYGPSETHVISTYPLSGDVTHWPTLPPIGRPLANVKMYILDAARQPVPVGVPGELYLGGAMVANGYIAREELTAERFLPNPFVEDTQARMYKTGDLALFLPDGNIKYLGRIDQQVKVRGFRIELGEIEEVLTQHPAVREAVAIVRQDVPGEKQLVAYVITNAAESLTVSTLRSFLQEKVPEYMVPSVFQFLDKFPLTPSGKVDRLALPEPEHHRPDLQVSYVAPETELERTIAAVWQEVLRVEQVGMHDNFFDLGGHSLLLVQVHNKLRERLGVELTVVQLFQYPTVGTLAAYLSQDQSGRSSAVQQSQNRAESRRESKGRRQARAKQRSLIKKGESIDE